jgi:hypothetical protein
VEVVDGLAEVVGERAGGGDGVRACLDLDGAVAACGLDEVADGPAGLVLCASKVRQYLAWLAGAERCLRSGPRRARRRLDLLEISSSRVRFRPVLFVFLT